MEIGFSELGFTALGIARDSVVRRRLDELARVVSRLEFPTYRARFGKRGADVFVDVGCTASYGDLVGFVALGGGTY